MTRTVFARALAVLTAAALGVAEVRAQGTPSSATPRTVVAQAQVSKTAAGMTAVRAVPGGRLQTIGLGMVAGKLAYTAFVGVPGKPGRTTVVIDANSGAVLSKQP